MAFDIETIWDGQTSVLLTSYWGWSPESWGMVSFANSARRENLLKELTDPFVALIYVTKGSSGPSKSLRGKVVGFYLVSHQKCHRNEYTEVHHHSNNPEKWNFGLKAIRAYSFHPESLISIDDFDSTVATGSRAQAIGTHGEILRDQSNWLKLRNMPFREEPCFGQYFNEDRIPEPQVNEQIGMVHAGGLSRNGYYVSPKTAHLPRKLYVLKLDGDADSFLGKSTEMKSIYKVGLSISPETRRQAFQKSLPNGAYNWSVYLTSNDNQNEVDLTFEAAVAGETTMKKYLARHGEWLGGEFYLASKVDISEAWQQGCAVASKFGS